MKYRDHRRQSQTPEEVQRGNRSWWSANPMTYDWEGEITIPRGTREWFEEIDRRFIEASRPYLTSHVPFDRIMPIDLRGQRVLEIGCGMGLHSLELARRGASLNAVDLTDTAIEMTRERMKVFEVTADIQRADAEALPYENETFDFVWSWGVIHHSARTARIVREIARVLKPHGQTRVMVYNRDGIVARLLLLRHYVLGGEFVRRTPDETLWRWTDGYSARYYHKEQAEDLFRGFFENVTGLVLGTDVDVVPLPRRMRRLVAPRIPDRRKLAIASRMGGFLFVTASDPLPPRQSRARG
jgi:2-polyprenyl-3-methyl-5-hydroxy-6-metoxy-1,4-benzoquinol methylase